MADNDLVQEPVDLIRIVVLKCLRLEARCAQDSCRGNCPPTVQQPLLASSPSSCDVLLWEHCVSIFQGSGATSAPGPRSVRLEVVLLCAVLIQREA